MTWCKLIYMNQGFGPMRPQSLETQKEHSLSWQLTWMHHIAVHFPFLITSRQTFGDIHFLDPQLRSVCSCFVCCLQLLWMIWTSFKGTTESPVDRKPNWAECLAWMHGLIFHALWGASAALATVAKDEQLVPWPANQSQTHPIKESSPNWFPPSTIAWDSEVRGSFFCDVCVWKRDRCRQWLDSYWNINNFKLYRWTKSTHFFSIWCSSQWKIHQGLSIEQ